MPLFPLARRAGLFCARLLIPGLLVTLPAFGWSAEPPAAGKEATYEEDKRAFQALYGGLPDFRPPEGLANLDTAGREQAARKMIEQIREAAELSRAKDFKGAIDILSDALKAAPAPPVAVDVANRLVVNFIQLGDYKRAAVVALLAGRFIAQQGGMRSEKHKQHLGILLKVLELSGDTKRLPLLIELTQRYNTDEGPELPENWHLWAEMSAGEGDEKVGLMTFHPASMAMLPVAKTAPWETTGKPVHMAGGSAGLLYLIPSGDPDNPRCALSAWIAPLEDNAPRQMAERNLGSIGFGVRNLQTPGVQDFELDTVSGKKRRLVGFDATFVHPDLGPFWKQVMIARWDKADMKIRMQGDADQREHCQRESYALISKFLIPEPGQFPPKTDGK